MDEKTAKPEGQALTDEELAAAAGGYDWNLPEEERYYIRCDICGEIFTSKNQFAMHLSGHIPPDVPS